MEQTTETLSMGWLSAAIWVPIISGIIVLALGNEQRATLSRWLALLGSLVGFAVTIPLYTGFDRTTAALQFVERKPWIKSLGIEYSLGIDGLSVSTAPNIFPTAMCCFASSRRSRSRFSSECQFRNFRPRVVGSAWIPCVRPMQGRCLYRRARSSDRDRKSVV